MGYRSLLPATPALALALAACSSGSGGQLAIAPVPPPPAAAQPTPPAPVPPAPTPPPPPPGPNGLQSADPFAVLGIGYRSLVVSGPFEDRREGPPAADPTETIEFRQIPGSDRYEILLPGFERGQLAVIAYNGSFDSNGWQTVSGSYNNVTRGGTAALQDVAVTLRRPAGPLNPEEQLRYTSWGQWSTWNDRPLVAGDTVVSGQFAYGIPTAAGDIPLTGSASYRADVIGETSVIPDRGWQEPVLGTAELRFDFGAGTLSGAMNASVCPWECVDVGRYAFRDTVYARGATTFSGKFAVPAASEGGFFEGQFTGPNAAELLARFQAPFKHPENGAAATMHGIWVGKRD